MTAISLLGPQRLRPSVGEALARFGITGPVAAVTAGWQEREAETGELEEHLQRQVVNLELYRRAEEVAEEDPELLAALRRRQERLRREQGLYRVRLDHSLAAVRELLERFGGDAQLEAARGGALEALRDLDDGHVERIRELHRSFDSRWQALERPVVRRHRRELRELLTGCAALALAGGHVAVLLNRLRLFGVVELAGSLPLVGWSAGAMVLADRIVLFHDSPPQGPGNAEVLEIGLDRIPGLLPLPDARRRLRLADPLRVSLLCRRFEPRAGVLLDDGSELTLEGGEWSSVSGVEVLTPDGQVERSLRPKVAS